MSAFCVKCRSKTDNVNPKSKVTKNGRHAVISLCGKCGTQKYQFVSGNGKPKKGKGFGSFMRGVLGSIF